VTVVIGALGAVAIIGTVLRLVVLGRLRVRYAALWLAIGGGLTLLAVVPGLLRWVSSALGFAVPANLLFFLGLVLLVLVGIHLSVAVTRLEDRVQRLVEELVLLAEQVQRGPRP
jgi:hypothetical protein